MTGGSNSPRLLPPIMGGIKTQTGGTPGGAKIFKIQGAPPGNGGEHRGEFRSEILECSPRKWGGSTGGTILGTGGTPGGALPPPFQKGHPGTL